MRSALLYSDMQSVVSLSLISKCMTLNDSDCLYRVTFCFRTDLARSDRATSENNCVKTNKDRHILSSVLIFGRDSSFWQYKVYAGTVTTSTPAQVVLLYYCRVSSSLASNSR